MNNRFLRTGTRRYKRLGSHRRKNQKWRRPRGRHSKIRERKKSRPLRVSIGYRTKKENRGKIDGKNVMIIRNMKDASNAKEGSHAVISRIGKKKRPEIEARLNEKKIIILNNNRKK